MTRADGDTIGLRRWSQQTHNLKKNMKNYHRIFVLLLFVLSVSVTCTNAQCGWCRRVSSNGTAIPSVCYGCNDASYLCSPSYSITSTCTNFRVITNFDDGRRSNANALAAECTDFNGLSQPTTSVSLDSFIGNQGGELVIGGQNYGLSCSYTYVSISGGELQLSARCRNRNGVSVSNSVSISSLLANRDGQLILTAAAPSSILIQPAYSMNLLTCKSNDTSCGVGFLRIWNQTSGMPICTRCNTTGFVASPGQYCDGFSSVFQSCPAGYYCLGSDQPKVVCAAGCVCPQNTSVVCNACLGSQVVCPQSCPDGHLCFNGTMPAYCPLRHYCQNNVAILCPANTFGDQFNLVDDSCAGSCGIMWTSKAGSMDCRDYSPAGIALIIVIVAACTAVYIFVSCNMQKWTRYFYPPQAPKLLTTNINNGNDIAAAAVSAASSSSTSSSLIILIADHHLTRRNEPEAAREARSFKQMQIRSGVSALVSKVNHRIFSSISDNIQQKMIQANWQNVEGYLVLARQQFTDHLCAALLAHPRLQFDDHSYPRFLPLWAERDPGSMDGEEELHATSNELSRALKIAVEQDFLAYFHKQQEAKHKQHQQQAPAEADRSPLQEEAKQQLEPPSISALVASEQQSLDLSWSWPRPFVDHNLKLALPKALPDPYGIAFLSSLRMNYFQSSYSLECRLPPLTAGIVWSFICTGFDLLCIVACFVCIIGSPLLTVELDTQDVNNSRAIDDISRLALSRVGFTLNWHHMSLINDHLFSYYDDLLRLQTGEALFQPILNQCYQIYGPIFYTLHLVALICFGFVLIADISSLLLANMNQCLSGGDGSLVFCWAKKQTRKVEALIRTLGLIFLTSAITVYKAGCISRLTSLSMKALVPFGDPYRDNHLISATVPTMTDLNVDILPQGTFELTIVALVGACLSTFWSFQKMQRGSSQPSASPPKNAGIQQQQNRQQQPPHDPRIAPLQEQADQRNPPTSLQLQPLSWNLPTIVILPPLPAAPTVVALPAEEPPLLRIHFQDQEEQISPVAASLVLGSIGNNDEGDEAEPGREPEQVEHSSPSDPPQEIQLAVMAVPGSRA